MRWLTPFWLVAVCTLSAVGLPGQYRAHSNAYDVLIRNGKIVDGTGNPWYHGDVGVRGDEIAAIGLIQNGKANRVINADGLVVAPGFVDIHSHPDFLLLEEGNAQSKIRQGVTTEVLGEGSSPGPYKGKLFPKRMKVNGKIEQWTTLGGYFDLVERAGISTNVASFVGLGTVWEAVMGKSHQPPTRAQLEEMKALVEEAMKQGAAGPSHVLPTGGTARFASGLSANDFLRRSSILSFTQKGMEALADDVRILANKEALTAHAASVDIRLDDTGLERKSNDQLAASIIGDKEN